VVIGGGSEYTTVDRIKKGKKIIVHGDGTSLWVLTHSEDFAKGFVGLMGLPQATGNAFQITSDEILTWNQIHEIIADAVGVKPNIVHISSNFLCEYDDSFKGSLWGDKSYSVIFDNTKIKTFVPGFCCIIPFSEGIKRTLAWFEADPKRMVIKKETNDKIDDIIKKYGG
jgi:nucleoside-diphosphate-sugar epimerase